MQGTRNIVKKNIILDNIKYIAINASGKSVLETCLLNDLWRILTAEYVFMF